MLDSSRAHVQPSNGIHVHATCEANCKALWIHKAICTHPDPQLLPQCAPKMTAAEAHENLWYCHDLTASKLTTWHEYGAEATPHGMYEGSTLTTNQQ